MLKISLATVFVAIITLVLVDQPMGRATGGGLTERVSVSSTGTQGNNISGSNGLQVTPDGRFVVFLSNANDLVANDLNNSRDVFLRDRATGVTEIVSLTAGGAQSNATSRFPSVSDDGRYVAFSSNASNLVADDTNGREDVFVRDRIAGTTIRASVSSVGTQASSGSIFPVISGDGSHVAFSSGADNLVTDDTNAQSDVFHHALSTGTTQRVSVSSLEAQSSASSNLPSISGDGRFVAFIGTDDLVAGDSNGTTDIVVRDTFAGTTEVVSLTSGGASANGPSSYPSISADGRFIAFQSTASNLVVDDNNGFEDMFVRDRANGTTEMISVSTGGAQGNGASSNAAVASEGGFVSDDGRFVAFRSDASNLITGDTNGFSDIFLRDRAAGTTIRVSVTSLDEQADGFSSSPSLSDHGRFIAWTSSATNLVNDDTNATNDVSIRDRCVDGSCSDYFAINVECPAGGGSTPSCLGSAGLHELGVTFTNNSGTSLQVGAFQFSVQAGQAVLDPQIGICSGDATDCNPDFDEAAVTGTWTCTPPDPAPDEDPDPDVAVSTIACSNSAEDGPIIQPGQSIRLATVHYSAANGNTQVTLSDVSINNAALEEVMSCNPVILVGGACIGASVTIADPTPTPTPTDTPTVTNTPTVTPTATATPCPDIDCDSVPDASDNCPSVPNTNQLNSDRNFIDHSPPFSTAVDDKTLANSDAQGDACDADDDNDGVPDADETGAVCGVATNPLLADSDGDRYLDGAECAIGTDATLAGSKPTAQMCADHLSVEQATDTDSDRIRDYIEFCFYNTDPSLTDTDGDRTLDGGTDGCEVASVNADRVVNIGDRGLVALAVANPTMRHVNVDVNKDGAYNVGDIGLVALHFGKCPG